MAVTAVMTMLCMAGVVFNVRFLAAMGKEDKARWTFHWACLRTGANKSAIQEQQEHKRAA